VERRIARKTIEHAIVAAWKMVLDKSDGEELDDQTWSTTSSIEPDVLAKIEGASYSVSFNITEGVGPSTPVFCFLAQMSERILSPSKMLIRIDVSAIECHLSEGNINGYIDLLYCAHHCHPYHPYHPLKNSPSSP
jgi:hypothetical protein